MDDSNRRGVHRPEAEHGLAFLLSFKKLGRQGQAEKGAMFPMPTSGNASVAATVTSPRQPKTRSVGRKI